VQWLITLAVISALVAHGLYPTVARIVAIAVNLPLGFIANRYLTFGVGIVPRVLRFRKAVK
jgi:putative flippase GtrA